LARVSIHVTKGTVEMGIGAFIGWTYFVGTKHGKKFVYESGKLAGTYAAKQLMLTGRSFVTSPAKGALRSRAAVAAGGFVVAKAPRLALLVAGGLAFNAIGHTHANQTAGHIAHPGSVLGMGGTL